jgi:DNA-binding beta-propeller fold protein YncE
MRSRDAFLARIDPSSTSVSARFSSLSTGPIAIGSDALWMVKWGALTRIDPGTNSFQERSYQAGLDGRIAVDDRFMWVADELGEAVWQLDAETWRVVRSIPVGDVPSGVAVGFGSVWVASAGGTVTRLDPTSGRVLAVIRTGATVRGIAAGSDAVWVSVG